MPYPLAWRRDLVTGIAEQMTRRPMPLAEKHLLHQLRGQQRSLERKGVPPEAIARQVRSLEAAIRAELWRLVLTPHRPNGAA